MNILIFDITNRVFGNEEQLTQIVRNYPDGSLLLVTVDQKKIIASLPGNSTRYIDMSEVEILNKKKLKGIATDVLVFDSVDGSYKFITGRALEKLE